MKIYIKPKERRMLYIALFWAILVVFVITRGDAYDFTPREDIDMSCLDIYDVEQIRFCGGGDIAGDVVNLDAEYTGDTFISGSFEAPCLDCDGDTTIFHGDGIFEGNITAPNIEVLETLIVRGNSTCAGEARKCNTFTTALSCGFTASSGQRGCSWTLWGGPCVGTETSCIAMSTATCEDQLDCVLTSLEGLEIGADGLSGNISITVTGNVTADCFLGPCMDNITQNISLLWTNASDQDTRVIYLEANASAQATQINQINTLQPGNCPSGQFVSGPGGLNSVCALPSYTKVYTNESDLYLTGGVGTGTNLLGVNTSRLNDTIDARAGGGISRPPEWDTVGGTITSNASINNGDVIVARDLKIVGANISTTGALNIKTNNEGDDYFRFETINGIPILTSQGNAFSLVPEGESGLVKISIYETDGEMYWQVQSDPGASNWYLLNRTGDYGITIQGDDFVVHSPDYTPSSRAGDNKVQNRAGDDIRAFSRGNTPESLRPANEQPTDLNLSRGISLTRMVKALSWAYSDLEEATGELGYCTTDEGGLKVRLLEAEGRISDLESGLSNLITVLLGLGTISGGALIYKRYPIK